MMKIFKKYFKYIFIFIFFFLCLQVFYHSFNGDQIYNYGFSYAVAKGEVPYKDFNMIIPSFSAYLYAIPLLIFGNNIIVFNLFQSFLICILFYFLFKLFDKKAYLFIPILSICVFVPFVTLIFQGYNFLLLLELVILLYLEKTKANDYLIGFVLGLSILSKQTVGFCLILVSLYYLFSREYKKVLKRIIGILIPCLIFLFSLILTKSLYCFIDLCFLGMFDFTSKNGFVFDYNFILFIFLLIYIIYSIFKDKRNINNYYILAFSMISVPLFDYYHVTIFLFSCIILSFFKFNFDNKSLAFNSCLLAFSLALIWYGFCYQAKPNFTNYKHFSYFIINKKISKSVDDINEYINNNKDENIIILGANAYFFKMSNDMNINYYDLLNYGNHGYNGTNKIIKMIKSENKPVFIINKKEYNDNSSERQQINKDVMKYVFDNYKVIDTIGEYVIYK